MQKNEPVYKVLEAPDLGGAKKTGSYDPENHIKRPRVERPRRPRTGKIKWR